MTQEVFFEQIKARILDHIGTADKSVKLAVSWLTDREIFQLLLKKLEEGVSVSIITRNDFLNNHPDALDWNQFIQSKGSLRFSKNGAQLHYKFILADDVKVLCTSYNLCCFANGNNRENGMIFSDPGMVNPFIEEFNFLSSDLEAQKNVVRLQWTDVPEELHGFYKGSLESDLAKQTA